MFDDVRLQAAIIAAIVGIIAGIVGTYLKHYLDKRQLRHRLETEYDYEERKKLQTLIGHYHGRMLQAAEHLNHRLWNLQANESRGWLSVNGSYVELVDLADHYYFKTTAHRFISLLTLIYSFQKEALYIEPRIAKGNELVFLKFAKSLEQVLTDAALFDDIDYDAYHQRDHFFIDYLRLICDCCSSDGNVKPLLQFQSQISTDGDNEPLKQLLDFFNGLCANEDRLRWDRIVVFHLLLMAFINTFGYDMQKSTAQQFTEIAKSAKNHKILRNLNDWLTKRGLDDEKEIKNINAAVDVILAST